MKTNRIVALLAVLCLITTCFVGTTLAKYTVSDSSSDTARVAKFGVTVDVTAEGAFATEYDAKNEYKDGNETVIAKTVVSSDGDKLVAPGTSGDLASLTIKGTPEVAVQVVKTADLKLEGDWTDEAGTYYCPLKITVGSDTFYGLDYDSIAAFEAIVEGAVNKTVNYPANTVLNDTDDFEASWAWDFEGTDGKQTDAKDTDLGDKAVNGDIKITLEVGASVTQLD